MTALLPQATPPLPPDALPTIASLVESRSGLRFVGGRRSELASKTARAFAESGCVDWPAYLAGLARSPGSPLLDQLVKVLTVGETYFFRHRPYFDLLEREIVPRLIAERRETRQLRIWSAGCATGEEAYSLAILVWRLLPDIQTWDVRILGTDLNTGFLAQAREGRYGAWSLRGADVAFTAAYFTPDGPRHRIKPSIARLVQFAPLNLVEPVYPSPANATSQVDLILCRNVLIYFGPEVAKQVVTRLRAALVPNGWLVLGPSDPHPGLLVGFEPYGDDGAVVYRRIEEPRAGQGASLLTMPAGLTPAYPTTGSSVPSRPHGLDRPGALSVTRPSAAPSVPNSRPGPDRPVTRPAARPTAVPARPSARRARPAPSWLPVAANPAPAETPSDVRVQRPASETPAWEQLWQAARTASAVGHLDEAEAACRQAIESKPTQADPFYLLGVLQQARGDDDAALAAFRQALYVDRRFVPAHLALATLFRQRGQHDRAQRALERARRLLDGRPDDDQILTDEPVTVGRLREVLARALGDAPDAPGESRR